MDGGTSVSASRKNNISPFAARAPTLRAREMFRIDSGMDGSSQATDDRGRLVVAVIVHHEDLHRTTVNALELLYRPVEPL
jgi:hypothetical protein